jgi:hypothetical protein
LPKDLVHSCGFVRSKSLSAIQIRALRDCGYAADNRWMISAQPQSSWAERASQRLSLFSRKSIGPQRSEHFLSSAAQILGPSNPIFCASPDKLFRRRSS